MNRTHTLALGLAALALVGCKDIDVHTTAKQPRFGTAVTLWVTYKDDAIPNDSRVQVRWTSDRQGEIGRGSRIAISDLRPGKHKITVRGRYGDESFTKKLKLEVKNDAPDPVIVSPRTGTTFGVGKTMHFKARVNDREDGRVPSSRITWSAGRMSLGSGSTLDVSRLRPGTHRVTVTATDRAGARATHTIAVFVSNRAPTVRIEPDEGTIVSRVGQSLTLDAVAHDPDPLNGSARIRTGLTWSSDKDGRLGQGESITLDGLSGGVHRIRVVAKDEFGKIGRATVRVNVVNRAPRVWINSPQSNSYFSTADTVRFRADADDPDGFAVDPRKVKWSSNKDGKLGTGFELSTTKLSVGQHAVTCTVTDAHGATARARVSVLLVNEAPVARIASPRTHTQISFGDALTLRGDASDKEDRVVDASRLVWKTGQRTLGTGRRLTVRDLGFGAHTITLTATDADGQASQPASVRVTVQNNAPQVTISSPGNAEQVRQGDAIMFSGAALDPDRNQWLSGRNLRWTARRHNGAFRRLGDGKNVSIDDLAPGRYRIVLTAYDPDQRSLTARARITLRVLASPATPTATAGGAPTTGTNSGGLTRRVRRSTSNP